MTDPPAVFRPATAADLPAVVRLLAADPLGARRERVEDPLPPSYADAFEAIASDPNQELVVAEADGGIVGVLQLTFIPSLTYQGSWRCQIEGVRVAESRRGQGLGGQMMGYALERARARHCRMVQLTTDKERPDAIAFYRRLGFVDSHEGMKLHLVPSTDDVPS